MRIALIVPFKNAKEWLPRCLKSIDPRFKLILVDDQSTDGTNIKEMAARYYRGVALFLNTEFDHGGVADARNCGLIIAYAIKADYITFLDADDELAPDAYNSMVAAVKECPDASIIQFNHRHKMADGRIVPRMPCKRGVYGLNKLPPLWVSSVNKLFKADMVKDIRFDNRLRHGEDELFVLKCLKKARKIHVSDYVTMLYHRDNPNSLSKVTSFDDLIDEQRALLELFIDYSDDRALCEAIRQRQVELWNNPTYRRVIGGAT